YQQAVRLGNSSAKPFLTKARCNAAFVAKRRGDYKSAINYLKNGLKDDPTLMQLIVQYQGEDAMNNQNFTAAISFFQKALTAYPTDHVLLAYLANAQGSKLMNTNSKAALQNFEKAYRLLPEDIKIQHNL